MLSPNEKLSADSIYNEEGAEAVIKFIVRIKGVSQEEATELVDELYSVEKADEEEIQEREEDDELVDEEEEGATPLPVDEEEDKE